VGLDTTVFRIEGSRLLRVLSAYLGIDTTAGSCPAAMSTRVPDLYSPVAVRRLASIAVLPAGVPRWSLSVPYGVTNARVPNCKRRPPAPSVPASMVSYPNWCHGSARGAWAQRLSRS
jgi:hypothetical protein